MFDKAFGAPDSSPFGVPPVAMVQSFICDHLLLYHPNPNDPFDNKDIVILEFLFFFPQFFFFFFFKQNTSVGQSSGSTAAFEDPFGNPFA